MDVLTEPLQSPAGWLAKDLRSNRSWIYELTPADISELEAALAETKRKNVELLSINAGNFPLPKLGKNLMGILQSVENGLGISLIRGLPIERYSKQDAGTIFWGVGTHLGRAVAQNAYGDVLGHVRDLGKDWTKDMNARGYETTAHQPFHNDSCDVVGLFCLRTAKKGGLSSIVSSVAIHNEMVKTRPDLARELYGSFYVDRRGEQAAGDTPYYITSIFNYHMGRLFNRFNRMYIESAQRFSEVPRLSDKQKEALDLFDALCLDERLRFDMDFKQGDMQYLNNYVTLHSRTGYEDFPDPDRKRHLLRLWLFTPGLVDIPEALRMRYRDMDSWQKNPRPPIYKFEEIMNISTH
jgi:hypothetical protein